MPLAAKVATRGEPFDLALGGWIADYADPASFFVPLLYRGSGAQGVNLDDPRVNARIEAANRLSGEARRKAWADLDVDLMRDNPPWAPLVHNQIRTFVSQSTAACSTTPSTTSTSQPSARSSHWRVSRISTPSSRERSRSSAARDPAPSSSARAAARSR